LPWLTSQERERERENNHFGSEGCKFHLEFLEWASNK
jgi:hypothetical protein